MTISKELNYNIRHNTLDRVPPYLERQLLSQEDERTCLAHEAYQMHKLSGYTLDTIHAVGSFTRDSTKPSNLDQDQDALHPLYQPQNWQKAGSFENIGHGIAGQWDPVNNIALRRALAPVLRLASRMLNETVRFNPWYDALLFGDRVSLAPSGGSSKSEAFQTQSFHPRSSAEILQDVRSRFFHSELAGRCIFRIESLGPAYDGVYGRTVHSALAHRNGDVEWDRAEVTLAPELLVPLLTNDLLPSERLVQQFLAAKQLLNETMHATGGYSNSEHSGLGRLRQGEPFFEDEEIADLGLSWENSVFGGTIRHLHTRTSKDAHLPSLGALLDDYPNWMAFGDGKKEIKGSTRYRKHRRFEEGSDFCSWPIHFSFIEDIQQLDYWNKKIAKFGNGALRPTRILGKRLTKGSSFMKTELGEDYYHFVSRRHVGQLRLEDPTPASELLSYAAFELEQKKKIKASVIMIAIRARHRYEQNTMVNAQEDIQRAIERDDLKSLEVFLSAAHKMWAAGAQKKSHAIVKLLRESPFPYLKVRALLLSSKLHTLYEISKRCSWVEVAIEEAEEQLYVATAAHKGQWEKLIEVAQVNLAELRLEMQASELWL